MIRVSRRLVWLVLSLTLVLLVAFTVTTWRSVVRQREWTTAVATVTQHAAQLRRDVAAVRAQVSLLQADSMRLAVALQQAANIPPRPALPPRVIVPAVDTTPAMVPLASYRALESWALTRVAADSVIIVQAQRLIVRQDSLLADRAIRLDSAARRAEPLPAMITAAAPSSCRIARLIPCPSRRLVFVVGTGLGVAAATAAATAARR